MNPLTNVRNVNKMNERELEIGYTNTTKSWHHQYRNSAWIFIGGLNFDLTEGDIVCVFSQFGEVVNIDLIRDPKTGKSRGYCFLCYEDQRSTILAIDNLNGARIAQRITRVDHVEDYKPPKEEGDETTGLKWQGCAPEVMAAREAPTLTVENPEKPKKDKKAKKEKKKAKKEKKKEERTNERDSSAESRTNGRQRLDDGHPSSAREDSLRRRDRFSGHRSSPSRGRYFGHRSSPSRDRYSGHKSSPSRDRSSGHKSSSSRDRYSGHRSSPARDRYSGHKSSSRLSRSRSPRRR